MTKDDKRNAYLYCKFRDMQFAFYDAYVKKQGLLMKAFLVLNVLYYAKDGLSQREICERTFQSKQTVSLIIQGLKKDGYITAECDHGDRRNKLIKLTERGRAYSEKPVTHITQAEDTAMSMFTAEEQEMLILLSRKFTQNLGELIRQED